MSKADLLYDDFNGVERMENMDMDEHLIERKKQSFWRRHKTLVVGIGCLIVGGLVSVGFSYMFFSLGKAQNSGTSMPQAGPVNSAQRQVHTDKNNNNSDFLLFTKEDSERLVQLIQNVRHQSQAELLLIKESKEEIMKLLAEIKNKSSEENTMRDCVDWKNKGYKLSGIYEVKPLGAPAFDVYCDMMTDGGGWLVFQRRINGSVDFFRDWASYENGFGDKNGEFWLGNKYIHLLTSEPTELRIELEDWENEKRYAKYSSFRLGDAKSKYTLFVDGYSGNAGDGLELHHEVKFSTRDQDNDIKRKDCANSNKGAWWYENCSHASLNGEYIRGTNGKTGKNKGINWEKWKGDYYSLKGDTMMLRRKS